MMCQCQTGLSVRLELRRAGFKSVLGHGNSAWGDNGTPFFKHLTCHKNPMKVTATQMHHNSDGT